MTDGKRDFFVSFNKADRDWATWIAWTLEGAGYSVFFQDWDFKGNFVLEMDKAHKLSRRTIAVLSPDYLTSRFAAPEWTARFAQDATNQHDLLIPVRVRPCELEGLLAQIVDVDLAGDGEAVAREKLLRRVETIRLKPVEPPLFPGAAGHEAVLERPAFPATAPTGNNVSAKERRPPSAGRHAPSASWLVSAVALAAVGGIAIFWLLASSTGDVAGNGGVAAGGGISVGRDLRIESDGADDRGQPRN
jgi:hypothetical protein